MSADFSYCEVEYHPEFLYFNKHVRDHGYEPASHPKVWDNGHGSAPFQLCNLMLLKYAAARRKKGAPPWPDAVAKVLKESGIFDKYSENIDVSGWLAYARSLDVEGMLKCYLPRLFAIFGDSFSIPQIKISPVRLTSYGPLNSFRALASGAYSINHMTHTDPAFYDLEAHIIYIPVPERKTALPPFFIDWLLLHEMFHAAVRPFLGRSYKLGCFEFKVYCNTMNRAFAEMFSEAGAFTVLEETRRATKRLGAPLLRARINSDPIYAETFRVMRQIGIPGLAALLQPMFRIARELTFLARETARTDGLTVKQARGILTKKYDYKKKVRGMDEEALKARLRSHGTTRIRAVLDEIERLDVYRMIVGAIAAEKSPEQKKNWISLVKLFSPDSVGYWERAGILLQEEKYSKCH